MLAFPRAYGTGRSRKNRDRAVNLYVACTAVHSLVSLAFPVLQYKNDSIILPSEQGKHKILCRFYVQTILFSCRTFVFVVVVLSPSADGDVMRWTSRLLGLVQ